MAFQSLNRPVTSCVPLEPLFLDFVTFLSGGSALTSWLPRLVVDCVTCLMVVPSLVPVNQVLRFHLYCVAILHCDFLVPWFLWPP